MYVFVCVHQAEHSAVAWDDYCNVLVDNHLGEMSDVSVALVGIGNQLRKGDAVCAGGVYSFEISLMLQKSLTEQFINVNCIMFVNTPDNNHVKE